MGDNNCVVCRHREPTYGYVCQPDQDRIAEQLADLLCRMAALETALVPSPAALSDRVSVSRTGSPTPARLDTLSLTGPGNVAVTAMMHPLVRRWSTVQTVTVTTVVGGKTVTREREITDWHQELACDADGNPVMVAPDDQIGVIPPAEWLDSWVRAWRKHFGHHVPARTHPANGRARARALDVTAAAANPATAPVLAQLATVTAAARQAAVDTVLGMNDGHGGRLPRASRPDDPLADEWEVRFGRPTKAEAPAADVRYLLTWLPAACEEDVGIAAMAAELRALIAELTRVLGDQPDQMWLGRCPSMIADPAGDTPPRLCAAGLWQSPYASQVCCPRCHSAWGPKRIELLHLAAEIRRRWPIDKRRRYSFLELQDLTGNFEHGLLPACPGCGEPARIDWRDVTATTDTGSWWRPDRSYCTNGCPEAERLI